MFVEPRIGKKRRACNEAQKANNLTAAHSTTSAVKRGEPKKRYWGITGPLLSLETYYLLSLIQGLEIKIWKMPKIQLGQCLLSPEKEGWGGCGGREKWTITGNKIGKVR